jgi:hypothetical protein
MKKEVGQAGLTQNAAQLQEKFRRLAKKQTARNFLAALQESFMD